jgi:tetratricopeptide (TPR) repeat protein
VEGGLPLELSLLEDQLGRRIYHVGFGAGPGHLLYVHLLNQRGDCDPQIAYREARDQFRGQSRGRDVERLLLAEQGRQAGFLLTGTDDLPAALLEVAQPIVSTSPENGGSEVGWLLEGRGAPQVPRYVAEQEAGAESLAFEQGLEALREERDELAIERLTEAVQLNPYHREAYLALLGVLDAGGRHSEAEFYGAMAARYLESDGLVRYRQGTNFVRQGRFEEAVAAFDDACRLAPDLYPPAYFAAHVLIAQGMDLAGAVERLQRAHETAPDEAHIIDSLRIARVCLRARSALKGLAGLLAAASLVALVAGAPSGWLGLFGAAVVSLTARPLTALTARRAAQRDVAVSPGQNEP